MRVALVQMTSGIDPAANAVRAAALVREAAATGAALILTPEMTGLLDGKRERMMGNARHEQEDATLAGLREAARQTGATILLGSVPILQGERCANRSFLISGSGEIVARYDKIHRFDVDLPGGERYRESRSYDAGTKAVIADAAGLRLGLTICYDVRFPHLFRALAQAGAQAIAVPAAFTRTTGQAHWHVLLRARAIETGCYVFAPAQSGHHEDGRDTFGHALIVNPWGEILADAGEGEGICFADIDAGAVAEARARIPSLQHDRNFEVVS